MDPEEIAAAEAAAAAAKEGETPAKAPSQKVERTEQEKAEFTLKKVAERVAELGGDPATVLGIKSQLRVDPSLPDEQPLTIKDLREIQKKDAQDSALQMADSIQDETERSSVKEILKTRIVPSGNPTADFALAQAAVNATKNARIAEEMARKSFPRRTAAGGSAPAPVADEFVPTEQEKIFMQKPYNLTKEQVLAKRPG